MATAGGTDGRDSGRVKIFSGNLKIPVDKAAHCAYLLVNKDGQPKPRRVIMQYIVTVETDSPEKSATVVVTATNKSDAGYRAMAKVEETYRVLTIRVLKCNKY